MTETVFVVGLCFVGAILSLLITWFMSSLSDGNTALKTDEKRTADSVPFDAGLRDLIQGGKLEEAVTIYQQFTGVSRSDAETEVERILWETRERQAYHTAEK